MGCRLTGIAGIDLLVCPYRRGWLIDISGPWSITGPVMHRAIVEAAARGRVAVIVVQDFGGLDPYRLNRLMRLRGITDDRILVARAFRHQDVPSIIEEASLLGVGAIVVRHPYMHAPENPREAWRNTAIAGSLRKASQHGVTVLVFNQPSPHGRRVPRGGSLHVHSAHVMIRLEPWRRGVRAELVKHPWRPTPRSSYVSSLELGWQAWAGQRPLTDYL